MRVVVVGASGNVGTAVLRRFAADPTVTSVVAVARRAPRSAVTRWVAGSRWRCCSDMPSGWSGWR